MNFVEVLLDFKRAGITIAAVAGALNLGVTTVGGWIYRGALPNFEDGRALLRLHEREVRNGVLPK